MSIIDRGKCIKSVIWQTGDNECSIGEPAIMLAQYADGMVCLSQEADDILINVSTLRLLARELNRLAKMEDI